MKAVLRVLGRQHDLSQWPPLAGQQRLDDVLPAWSPAGNAAWLDAGIGGGDPFVQISAAVPPGSMLAWELQRLRAAGYCACGPFWLPRRWLRDAVAYRRTLRGLHAWLLSLPRPGESVYVPKAAAELEPMLALWPHVLALPVAATLTLEQLIVGRALPVHPLGVVTGEAWADGRSCCPAEFWCHDLDHARYKLREDLLLHGVDIGDPYRHGSTFDAATGRHRSVLPAALAHRSAALWAAAPARARLAQRLLSSCAAAADAALGEAARWLLFELLHEKGLPLDLPVLRRRLGDGAPVAKLRQKCARGFFAAAAPSAAAVASLDAAAGWLDRALAGAAP